MSPGRADALSQPRGSWGHALRAATSLETVLAIGLDGAWTLRRCGRHCQQPIAYVSSYRLTPSPRQAERDQRLGDRQRPRFFRRFICRDHAERFARRYGLTMPGELRRDQALLPFGGT